MSLHLETSTIFRVGSPTLGVPMMAVGMRVVGDDAPPSVSAALPGVDELLRHFERIEGQLAQVIALVQADLVFRQQPTRWQRGWLWVWLRVGRVLQARRLRRRR